jgi:hypothetical protein
MRNGAAVTNTCSYTIFRDTGRGYAPRPPNRPSRGPYSTGAVEAVNFKLASELIGERANRMGNRARAFKLLDLLTVGLTAAPTNAPSPRPSASTSKATAAARSSTSARTTTSRAPSLFT